MLSIVQESSVKPVAFFPHFLASTACPLRGYGSAGTQNDRRAAAVILSTGTLIPAQWTCRRFLVLKRNVYSHSVRSTMLSIVQESSVTTTGPASPIAPSGVSIGIGDPWRQVVPMDRAFFTFFSSHVGKTQQQASELYISSISASPTSCPVRGYGRGGTQNDRLEEERRSF